MKLLDLFCGAGGASVGYSRAGFDEIVGVDINKQKDYPFQFIQADALTFPLDGFDAIHASPPCQAFSLTRNIHREVEYPNLIPIIRERFKDLQIPWVIENVVGAPLDKERTIRLCGTMFEGLKVYRHRLFESNIFLFEPDHGEHTHKVVQVGRTSEDPEIFYTVAGHFGDTQKCRAAMGVDWKTSRYGLAQMIPPAYTHYIGRQLIKYIKQLE